MLSPTLAEDRPRAADPEPKAVRGTSGLPSAVSGLASAVLLWVAFPPIGWSWLAWVALAPLFLQIVSVRSRASLYFGAWAGGMAFWLLSIHWVRLTDETAWLAWMVMALALSVWWPGFLALARLAVLRLRLPVMIAAPVLWVGLEFIRAYVLTGFPWYYLAHSQHRVLPLIQIADFAGALGLSFLIALVNAWWVDLLTLPLLRPTDRGPRLTRAQVIRLAALVVLLGATIGYGTYRLASARFRPGPRLALLQSNIIQRYKMSAGPEELIAIYRRLINRALRSPGRPDLIVWPETSYPYGYVEIDPGLAPAEFARQVTRLAGKRTMEDWRAWKVAVARQLHSWTDEIGVPMLVGAVTYDFRRDGPSKFNSAILFTPGAEAIQSYHKVHLVPFGEYVPLVESLPWLTVLTPYRGTQVPNLTFGRAASWFQLGPYRLAAAICFEDTVPQAVRRLFRGDGGNRQPDLVLNLSNDGWFHGSSEHDMHLATSVFRAVENRVPLARAVNTGISALIDSNGRILDSLPKLTEGVLSKTVQLDDRTSLYSAWGDWLGLSCLAVSIGLLPLALARDLLARLRS